MKGSPDMIVKKLYEFFSQNNKRVDLQLLTFVDFLNHYPSFRDSENMISGKIDLSLAFNVDKICRKMVEDGLLIRKDYNPTICLGNTYIAPLPETFDKPELFRHHLEYGCYDFKYYGFPLIRWHFEQSVLAIAGNKDGKEDIGSAYYIGNNMIVTAAHCIDGLDEFKVIDIKENTVAIKEIWYSDQEDRDSYDLAIIITDVPLSIPTFDLEEPRVLDKVLTMGFPPIPGLKFIQTAETATVGAIFNPFQKSSEGEVVAEANSYFHTLDYFLINARVKGGNSGGPVINELGQVIGTVVQIPFDNQGGSDGGRYDIMGYGVCLPSKYVRDLINNHKNVEIKLNGRGFYKSNS